MAQNILLKIFTPTKKVFEKKVCKVVIPAHSGKLTVLNDRVPSEILLTSGFVEILDENANVIEKYEIGAGLADYADNTCTIYTTFISSSVI